MKQWRSLIARRLPPNPFTMWLIRERDEFTARICLLAIYERQHQHSQVHLGQPPQELLFEVHKLFRSLIRVRNHNDRPDQRIQGLQQQAFAIHAVQDRPPNLRHRQRNGLIKSCGSFSPIDAIDVLEVF